MFDFISKTSNDESIIFAIISILLYVSQFYLFIFFNLKSTFYQMGYKFEITNDKSLYFIIYYT